jgi:protein O-GlcNAc transferase
MKSGKAALLAAERSLESGDVARAERILRQLVADANAAARAYELLAYICGNRNDLATCEALLLKAATLPDCSAEALYYLGQAQVRRGRGRAAVASFQRCLGMTGDSFEVLHELGVAYVGLEEFESALSCFERAGRVKPGSYEVHHNQGNVLRELQRLEDSLRHYDAALQIDPQRATGWADRAETLMALGRLPQALDSYDRSLVTSPYSSAAHAPSRPRAMQRRRSAPLPRWPGFRPRPNTSAATGCSNGWRPAGGPAGRRWWPMC